MKVIRCGTRNPQHKLPALSNEDLACLQGYWELEEQLGIRPKPQDRLLEHIPQITRSNQTQEGNNDG